MPSAAELLAARAQPCLHGDSPAGRSPPSWRPSSLFWGVVAWNGSTGAATPRPPRKPRPPRRRRRPSPAEPTESTDTYSDDDDGSSLSTSQSSTEPASAGSRAVLAGRRRPACTPPAEPGDGQARVAPASSGRRRSRPRPSRPNGARRPRCSAPTRRGWPPTAGWWCSTTATTPPRAGTRPGMSRKFRRHLDELTPQGRGHEYGGQARTRLASAESRRRRGCGFLKRACPL